MSKYNADPNPDTDRIRQVAYAYALAAVPDLKVDQFSTASNLKVYHMVQKFGSNRLQALVNPDEIPF